jgi:hypothetical protein
MCAVLKTFLYVEVDRISALLFHLFSKALSQTWHKHDLFSEIFKLKISPAQSMKPKPDTSPKKSGPTHLYFSVTNFFREVRGRLLSNDKLQKLGYFL